jgi:imidazolonepropionase
MTGDKWQELWLGAGLATMTDNTLGLIEDGAMAVADGKITWIGRQKDLPNGAAESAAKVHRLVGGWILPGFIDCHTHLLFAGDRAEEFNMRLEGHSYEDIARAGGGIISSVKACRAASEEELIQQSLPRLESLASGGVTTVEIKSGYGLDLDTELKMLRAARALKDHVDVDIETTFLGAHAIPPEFAGHADQYIEELCSTILPQVAEQGLASAVDGFCESIAFSPGQIEKVFNTATKLGLKVKLHADQLSDLGGAKLAAKYKALSADHLEFTGMDGVSAMAEAGTVAVLLPGAFYFLGETKKPPIQAFRDHKVAMALATDCNPGSSPVTSLPAILSMGCNLFGMTPNEALLGVTKNAAHALDLTDGRGALKVGAQADFCHWQIETPRDLCYWLSGDKPQIINKSND